MTVAVCHRVIRSTNGRPTMRVPSTDPPSSMARPNRQMSSAVDHSPPPGIDIFAKYADTSRNGVPGGPKLPSSGLRAGPGAYGSKLVADIPSGPRTCCSRCLGNGSPVTRVINSDRM
jgi:hypothetical protein